MNQATNTVAHTRASNLQSGAVCTLVPLYLRYRKNRHRLSLKDVYIVVLT